MLKREWIYRRLRHGAFPCLVRVIGCLHDSTSLNRRIGLKVRGKHPRGAAGVTEVYLTFLLMVGALWFMFVNAQPIVALSTFFWRTVGSVIAGYFIYEFGLFLVNWLIVGRAYLQSRRRSLVLFILNIPQMAIFFGILLSLSNCYTARMNAWETFIANIRSLGSIILEGQAKSVDFSESLHCEMIAHSQTAIGTILIVVIILSVAASLVRPDLDRPA